MRPKWLHTLVLLAVAGCLPGQQPKSQPKANTSAAGVFVGKSGKPMAGARLILCQWIEEKTVVRLSSNVPTATADAQGRFTFSGYTPGVYTIAYLPAGVDVAVPNDIDVSALEGVDASLLPLLVRVELGTSKPYEPRAWGPFTLLKGHTLWSMGKNMKVWNASARRGKLGPILEVRRGNLRLYRLELKSEIKLDAWSF
jgi:hypothetical protein